MTTNDSAASLSARASKFPVQRCLVDASGRDTDRSGYHSLSIGEFQDTATPLYRVKDLRVLRVLAKVRVVYAWHRIAITRKSSRLTMHSGNRRVMAVS